MGIAASVMQYHVATFKPTHAAQLIKMLWQNFTKKGFVQIFRFMALNNLITRGVCGKILLLHSNALHPDKHQALNRASDQGAKSTAQTREEVAQQSIENCWHDASCEKRAGTRAMRGISR
jgi:hypothetical protein